MKINVLLAMLALVLAYATCKTFKQEAPAPTAEPSALAAPASQGEPASYYGAAHVLGFNHDTARPVQIHKAPEMVSVPVGAMPPPSASRKAYLGTGWWHCNMAFSGIDSLIHHNYQNKWMKFRDDQTFDILIKGQVVDTGRWTWDEEKNEIYLSCKDPYLNNSWNVIDKGFVMIWKGNTAINLTGIQVRVACSKNQPNW
jgi:hypothetical protein